MNNYSELKTIRDFIRFATSRFNESGLYFGHGTDNAWDEAFALVLHTLHLPHDVNLMVLDANLTKEEQAKLLNLIEKRTIERIPVPYLTHEAWFAGLSFYVDERVLIPRSSFFELIENHFQPWISETPYQILDLCTGSGCIGIACAKIFPDSEVDAVDISSDALAVAKINILKQNVSDQVKLYESDLFNQLPKKKYDLIISNPPYVSLSEMPDLPREFHHEPSLGLSAGNDGLDLVKRILREAHQYLTPNGAIIIEVGNSEMALTEQYPNVPFTWIEFERSEGGIFLLTAEELTTYYKEFI